MVTSLRLYVENLQLADKVYFSTGKLSDKEKSYILGITGGDNYTKIISDIFYYNKNSSYNIFDGKYSIVDLYDDMKHYNKNIFPIKGFDDIYNIDMDGILELVKSFEYRHDILEYFKLLPSVAMRNMKNDMRVVRDNIELKRYYDDLSYFMTHYSFLDNRNDEVKKKFINKMFKSNTTLDDLMNFVDDKSEFIGGVEISKDDVVKLSSKDDYLTIVYDKGDVMIVEVSDPASIKEIGCNSLWCFTYGDRISYRQWNEYSYNGIVYVIIDFSKTMYDSKFMYVLVGPLLDEDGNLKEFDEDDTTTPLYDMMNDNLTYPYNVLEDLFGSGYEDIIRKYLNFFIE